MTSSLACQAERPRTLARDCGRGYDDHLGRRRRPLGVAVLLVGLLMTSAALAASPDASAAKAPKLTAATLLATFAKVPGLEAAFTQQKKIQLLAEPLVSSGHLYFAQPGYLAFVTEKPSPSKVVITPSAMGYRDSEGTGRIDLSARPDVKLFVESFVKVLAGDATALDSIYEMSFKAPERAHGTWQIVLRPKRPPLDKLIVQLRVVGHDFAVESVHIQESSGDSTTIRIHDVDHTRHYSDQERKTLFKVPGR